MNPHCRIRRVRIKPDVVSFIGMGQIGRWARATFRGGHMLNFQLDGGLFVSRMP